jgi:excisionase family DNA binding protein
LDSTTARLDIAAAAARLGISQDGVRKRIKRGQLGAYRMDGRTYVVLDNTTNGHDRSNGPDTTRHDNGQTEQTDTTGPRNETAGLRVVLARLEDEVRFLRGELERKDTIILAMVQERRALLAAPSVIADTPAMETTTPPGLHRVDGDDQEDAAKAPPDRPGFLSWWRRWAGWRR